jgi:hypothetical protein
MNLVASLAESRVQHEVGAKALAEIGVEAQQIERDVADLKARRPDAVRAAMIEASDGFRADLLIAIDDLRQVMTILAALDRITARSDGSWSPNERIAVEVPALGTMPAQPVVAPNSCIERARSAWSEFAAELEENPLASVEDLRFPHVLGNEDDGRTVYADLSRVERQAIDLERASGVN